MSYVEFISQVHVCNFVIVCDMIVSKKGRTLRSGCAIDESLRRLVIDYIVSSGGDIQTGFFPGSFASVSNYFKLSRSTVSKLWNQCCQEGSIAPRWKGGNNPSHLNDQDLELISALKSSTPSIPYLQIYDAINEYCEIPAGTSVSAIGRAVRTKMPEGKYTWKRMTHFRHEKFTADNVDYCQDFLTYVSALDPYKLKYFDEAGFALPGVEKANYGHSLVNIDCIKVGRHVNRPNVTLNMMIGVEGLLYANTENGASDTLKFLNFFGEASNSFGPNGRPVLEYGDYLFLDNCSAHHYEGGYALAEWLENLGVEVIYLPTYSPELNPIELAFNKLKKIAHQDEKRRAFARNIHEGVYKCLEDLTAEDCIGFFKKVSYLSI